MIKLSLFEWDTNKNANNHAEVDVKREEVVINLSVKDRQINDVEGKLINPSLEIKTIIVHKTTVSK